jgi:hypothetical protein
VVFDNAGEIDDDDVVVTVQDTTPPIIEAALVPIGGDDDGDEGLFRVEFSVSDSCEDGLTVKSFMKACRKKIPVENGQIIEIERDDDCEIEWDDGILEIEAKKVFLVVKAVDSSGNVNKVKAFPQFSSGGDEDDDD